MPGGSVGAPTRAWRMYRVLTSKVTLRTAPAGALGRQAL